MRFIFGFLFGIGLLAKTNSVFNTIGGTQRILATRERILDDGENVDLSGSQNLNTNFGRRRRGNSQGRGRRRNGQAFSQVKGDHEGNQESISQGRRGRGKSGQGLGDRDDQVGNGQGRGRGRRERRGRGQGNWQDNWQNNWQDVWQAKGGKTRGNWQGRRGRGGDQQADNWESIWQGRNRGGNRQGNWQNGGGRNGNGQGNWQNRGGRVRNGQGRGGRRRRPNLFENDDDLNNLNIVRGNRRGNVQQPQLNIDLSTLITNLPRKDVSTGNAEP